MSAAYKYAALQAFCIPTEGDNDADATTHELAPDPGPDPDPGVAQEAKANDLIDAINAAKEVPHLAAIGQGIAKVGLPHALRYRVAAAYRARMDRLRAEAAAVEEGR